MTVQTLQALWKKWARPVLYSKELPRSTKFLRYFLWSNLIVNKESLKQRKNSFLLFSSFQNVTS